MAREMTPKEVKSALTQMIQRRRASFISTIVFTPAFDALLAYLFSGLEKRWEPTATRLSEEVRKHLSGQPGRRWAFDIHPHQFIRYCLYVPIALPLLWLSDNLVKTAYDALLPTHGKVQELEKVNYRESYLQSPSLYMLLIMLSVVLELHTDFNIPKIALLMLINAAMLSGKADLFSKNLPVYFENSSFDQNHTVFFKPSQKFLDNPDDALRALMFNGTKIQAKKGDGFFERDVAQRGYALKARLGNKKVYFTKETDEQGDSTYHQLDSKPKRPGKIA